MDKDNTSITKDEPVANKSAPTLDPRVRSVVDQWWSDALRSVGPMISTQAYNTLSELKSKLIDNLTLTLA